jgi:hypothetical protein
MAMLNNQRIIVYNLPLFFLLQDLTLLSFEGLLECFFNCKVGELLFGKTWAIGLHAERRTQNANLETAK